jgi:hypothetical protein
LKHKERELCKTHHKTSHNDSTDDEYSDSHYERDYSDTDADFPHCSDGVKSTKYKTEMCKNFSEKGHCSYY